MNYTPIVPVRTPVLDITSMTGAPLRAVFIPRGESSPTRPIRAERRALVEFYDARYDFTEHGQFTGGEYYAGDIIARGGRALALDMSIQAWYIPAAQMAAVAEWLTALV